MSRRAARREDGFVMIAVAGVLMMLLILGAIAVSTATGGRTSTAQDLRSQRAQQAADTGAQQALLRANQLNLGQLSLNGGLAPLTTGLGCLLSGLKADLGASASPLAIVEANVAANCSNGTTYTPPTTPGGAPPLVQLPNRSAYRVALQMKPVFSVAGNAGVATLKPVIVSEGHDTNGTATESDDRIRRVEVLLDPVDAPRLVEATGDVTFTSADSLVNIGSTVVNGAVRANDDINVTGLAVTATQLLNGSLLGDLEYGPSSDDAVNLNGIRVGFVTIPLTLPPVPAPQRMSAEFTRTPTTVSPLKPDCVSGTCPSSSYYSTTTHRLTVPALQTLTLASGDYVFCGVDVKGTLRTAQTGAAVRIFVDDPNSARCNVGANRSGSSFNPGVGDLNITGALNPGVQLTPSRLQLYAAGDGTGNTTRTSATINAANATVTQGFTFYGPDTDVTVKYSVFTGSVIGHDVTMSSTTLGLPLGVAAVMTQDLSLASLPASSSAGVFRQRQYVTCSPQTWDAVNPSSNC